MAWTGCSSAPTICRHRSATGNWGHPEVQEAIRDAGKRIRAAGKAAGILTPNEEEAKRFIDWGYSFAAVSSDVGLLSKNADGLAKRFKS